MENAELYKALIKFQGMASAMPKTTAAFKFKYVELHTIWDAIREPLQKCGLGVIQTNVSSQGGRVGVRTILVHESGQSIEDSCYSIDGAVPNGVSAIQKQGMDITYLRRYGLSSILGLTTEPDKDGNS